MKNIKRLMVMPCIAILSASVFASSSTTIATKVKNAADDYIKAHKVSASYVVSNDDGVITSGVSEIKEISHTKQLLDVNKPMPIASTTKFITAVAILKLQDLKKLNVQDKISKHLADSPIWDNGAPKWLNDITIHHLLTHQSGIIDYLRNMKIDPNGSLQKANHDIVNFAAKNELSFKPGSEFKYCSTSYVLLGLIIEKVAGQKYGDFLAQQIFKPLKMESTRLVSFKEAIHVQKCPEECETPVRYWLLPTEDQKTFFQKIDANFIASPYSDGGVFSTAPDLMKLTKAFHNGKILTEESYKLMTTKYAKVDDRFGADTYTGYGLYISEFSNGKILYLNQPGSEIGIRSEVGYIPSAQLYFSILGNVGIPPHLKDKIDTTQEENKIDIYHFAHKIIDTVIFE